MFGPGGWKRPPVNLAPALSGRDPGEVLEQERPYLLRRGGWQPVGGPRQGRKAVRPGDVPIAALGGGPGDEAVGVPPHEQGGGANRAQLAADLEWQSPVPVDGAGQSAGSGRSAGVATRRIAVQ